MSRQLVYVVLLAALLGLGVAQAQGSPYVRAVYWDSAYPAGWAGGGEAVRDALEDAGYQLLDAAALRSWMDDRIADGKMSVVVFCRDIVPDTVAETQDADCTIRQYLNSGGKVVWYADIPFYYCGHAGSQDTWGTDGSVNVMGFNMAGGAWDSGNTVTITDAGTTWGLTATWASQRPTTPDGWADLTILATDDAGNPAAWAAHYVPGDTFRGFVRISDVGGDPSVDDLMAVAEYYQALPIAMAPKPDNDETDVVPETTLSWTAGDFAAAHDAYLGTSFDDVNDASRTNPLGVLVSEGQTALTFDPDGDLELGQTYYWRIDEVNAAPDNTIFKGAVWRFTVEPLAYAIAEITATTNAASDAGAGPENTVNGSGLNAADQHSTESGDMWLCTAGAEPVYLEYEFDRVYKLHEMLVWNYNVQFELVLGFGVKDVTVEYSTDGADWTTLGDVEFAQGTASADYAANTVVDFGGVAARYVRFNINAGWGGLMPQFGLSEVRFMYIPAHAREPQPADAAMNVDVTAAMSWRVGRDAVSHEVYFGADAEALTLADTVETPGFVPGAMDLDATYYWKVDEVQADESWPGDVWSFSTQAYLVVEDFESYDDEDNRIYQSWVDGYGVNSNGSTVGHLESPFAEQSIVKSGRQSMPLFYDNSTAASSEAELTLNQNWTLSDIKGLSLQFHGAADNAGQLYVKINNSKILYDGHAVNIARPSWQPWSIDLAAVSGLASVTKLTIGVEGAGAKGVVYIDDVRLYPEVLDDSSPDITGAGDAVQGVPNDGDWPGAETPDMLIDDSAGTKFLHFKGAAETTGFQVTPLLGSTIVTGISFTTANDAAERDPVAFELYGSNAGIDGPYTLIASGDITDFAQDTEWPRQTKNETPISFNNSTAYTHYQVLCPAVRNPDGANSMQIAEVELIGAPQ